MYIIPVEPLKNIIGKNTTERTVATPIKALVISLIAIIVASFAKRFFSLIFLSTFSTTTIASSTNKPIDKTIANIVKEFIVNPKKFKIANVPSNTTGTATAGIIVALQLFKKTNITITTKNIASKSVFTTSFIDASIKIVVS